MENSNFLNKNKNYSSKVSKPVVFILGPTGVGKTKVSFLIAKLLNGEIINSDAFSLYRGADILTTKASLEERKIIPLHMVDILDLTETNFKILDYVKESSNVINTLLMNTKNNPTPVIVGGTNYYVQAILFEKAETQLNQLNNTHQYENECNNSNEKLLELKAELKFRQFNIDLSTLNLQDDNMKNIFDKIQEIKNLCLTEAKSEAQINSSASISASLAVDNFNKQLTAFLSTLNEEQLGQILKLVDPGYSTFLHKNDTRRIQNAVIYYFSYGKKKSEKISREFLKLKYPNSVMIFLNPIVKEPFYSRLESRVGEMIEQDGLVEIFKILSLFYSIHGPDIENHFDKGILQAIGYKEFFPLFKVLINSNNLSVTKSGNPEPSLDTTERIKNLIDLSGAINLFIECKKKHVNNTVKYAKSQLKFIKNRLLPYINSSRVIEIKVSEFTDDDYSQYINQAYVFVRKFFDEDFIKKETHGNPDHCLKEEIREKFNKISIWEKFYCEICKAEMNGQHEYKNHLKSNKHKKKKKSEKLKKEKFVKI